MINYLIIDSRCFGMPGSSPRACAHPREVLPVCEQARAFAQVRPLGIFDGGGYAFSSNHGHSLSGALGGDFL